ncbi:MAG: bacteriohemerythrin [Gammaproteobacteria bacterium]
MALFQWDASYCVGIPEVDDQHEKLVGMVNRLDEAVTAGRDETAIDQILKGLLDYTRYHFGTEERLMEAAGLQDDEHYKKHKNQHIDFVNTVVEEVTALRRNHEPVSAPLLQYLIKWLVEHILGSDREMARHLQNPSVPEADDREAGAHDADRAKEKLLSALHESEWRFRVIADSAPVLIWMCDAAGRRAFFNQAWCEFTGLQHERLEEQWSDRLHPADKPAVLGRYAKPDQRQATTMEYRLRNRDGEYRWMLESAVQRHAEGGAHEGYVGSCVDVTDLKQHEQVLERQVADRTAELRDANERLEQEKAEQLALIQRLKETQAQLLQSAKMASIGQLAAGVAHEINNPVGYVKSNLNALARYVKDLIALVDAYEADPAAAAKLRQELDYDFLREDVETLVDESHEGVDRVQSIVQDLKDFSHVDRAEWQTADLHRGLDSTLNMVWNEFKYKAEVVKEYGELPPVECLARQLNQVFMNILVNAGQAISDHGTITLRTRRDGDWAVVEISDTGAGIAPDKLSSIFDPFFTTKPVGKGTGLGLSIAYGIIEKHHGRIEVDSTVGKGTTFRIFLPITRVKQVA